ncbi:MAG TPA: Uma2 family endonuclease [Bryobacteraceae bacterium]
MVSVLPESATLITGEKMSKAEFLCRWEALPEIKVAELIEGVVFVPSPVSVDHGERNSGMDLLLGYYAAMTPGCAVGTNATWEMLESVPQPDVHLRIQPEHGRQSSVSGKYPVGAPELAVEICLTSTEVDFGPKLRLYERAGVREYITVELLAKRIVWRVLRDRVYQALEPDADGVLRSIVFPGLWLDQEAFWRNDGTRMLATLEAGLATAEHQEFAARLRG